MALQHPGHPRTSLLFLGPTGPAKTDAIKSICEKIFGSQGKIVRVDTNWFDEKTLIPQIHTSPSCIVLFANIENATPEVLHTLFQILDTGKLVVDATSSVSCEEVLLICTFNTKQTNLGNEEQKKNDLTFTFTPQGSLLVTIGNIMNECTKGAHIWTKKTLEDFFSGQLVEALHEKHDNAILPKDHINTYTIFPNGVEMISAYDMLFYKAGAQETVWNVISLSEYLKADISSINTHTVSPAGVEMINSGHTLYTRKHKTDQWEISPIREYFDKNDDVWDAHSFSPSGTEVLIIGDTIWQRTGMGNEWKSTKLAFAQKKEPIQDRSKEKAIREAKVLMGEDMYALFNETVYFEA